MTDMSKDAVERMDPRCDAGGHGYMLWMEYCNDGEYIRATDYDALAAKLADAERVARYESDIAQQALDRLQEVEAELANGSFYQEKDIDALQARAEAAEAKLAKVTDDCDDLQIALASARKQLERYIGEAEAERVAENDLRKRKRTLAKLRGATTPKGPN